MQIPLISRIRFKHAVIFTTVIFTAQQLEGTDLLFSSLFATYILISTIAFNAAGGFVFPTGWFIFFNSTLSAIFGLTYKVFLGEPGNSHLRAANTTMLAYCFGMILFGLAAALTRKLVPKGGVLTGMAFGENMKQAAIGAFIVGAILQGLSYSVEENGSFLSAIKQVNFFTQMGLLLAVFYQVKKTDGKQSTNWIVWTSGTFLFILGGLLSFSKQGALNSIVTWLAAAIAAGHNFSRKQILVVLGLLFFFQSVMVPYSQVGRNLRGEDTSFASDVGLSFRMMSSIGEFRQAYAKSEADAPTDDGRPHLYDQSHGFWDRLSMLPPDDALISYTTEGNVEGLLPTTWAFINIVPHFIWKDKPFYYTGNIYAREVGMIAEDNDVTGISFSPTADAFHQAEWFGVAILDPCLLFLMFMVMDFLSGDIRKSPWGLLFCVTTAHSANEGMLGGQVYIATYIAFGVVVMALMARYVLPVFSGVITNTDRTRVRKTVDFKPVFEPRSTPFVAPRRPGSSSIK